MNTSPIISIASPVSIQAADGKTRIPSFEATIYTGGELEIAGYDQPIVIDLEGLTTGNTLVANLDHDSTKRVGNFTVSNDGQKLVARGTASAATPWRDEVVASARDGYAWQASVEVAPKKIQTLKRGESANVNGRTFEGPKYITRSGVLKAFAFVSHGADDNTTVSIAAQKRGNAMHDSDFQSWMAGTFPSLAVADMTQAQLAGFHANYSGRHAADASDFAAVAPMIEASSPNDPVAVEEKRIRQIDRACNGDNWGDHAEDVQAIKAQAIEKKITVDELLDQLRPIRAEIHRSTIPMARTVRASSREAHPKMIEAALYQAAGLPDAEKHYDERTLEAAHSAYRGGFGLQQLLLAAAAQNGYPAQPGARITAGNVREVLQYAFPPIHAAGFSTLSVSGILSNIGNKSLLQGWNEGDTSWRMVCQIKSVSDFKQHTSYRMLDDMEYEELAPAGEIKHGTLSEESYTRQAKTYAKMAAITRTQIINDDLSAFDDLRVRIGRGALTKFNKVFWAAFMANTSFFHSDHSNVSTGSPGSVLGTDGVGLQAAVLKFRQLKSADEKTIDGEPTMLVVPPELEFAARRLYQSTNIVATGDTDATMTSGNAFAGLYKPLIQNRLSDSTYTGYSTTAWYLLRDPNIAAVVVASFLNGNQNPTVDMADADFSTLGIQVRGYHDFGVDRTVDYLAGIRSAGA